MKILIKEDKRNILAKQILTEEFSDLDIDESDYKDSNGIHKRLNFSKNYSILVKFFFKLYISEKDTVIL
jgi:hypothetical protein